MYDKIICNKENFVENKSLYLSLVQDASDMKKGLTSYEMESLIKLCDDLGIITKHDYDIVVDKENKKYHFEFDNEELELNIDYYISLIFKNNSLAICVDKLKLGSSDYPTQEILWYYLDGKIEKEFFDYNSPLFETVQEVKDGKETLDTELFLSNNRNLEKEKTLKLEKFPSFER